MTGRIDQIESLLTPSTEYGDANYLPATGCLFLLFGCQGCLEIRFRMDIRRVTYSDDFLVASFKKGFVTQKPTTYKLSFVLRSRILRSHLTGVPSEMSKVVTD